MSEKAKVSIKIDATVLIDADYNDDGLEASLSDGIEGTDFALSATPTLEITAVNQDEIQKPQNLTCRP